MHYIYLYIYISCNIIYNVLCISYLCLYHVYIYMILYLYIFGYMIYHILYTYDMIMSIYIYILKPCQVMSGSSAHCMFQTPLHCQQVFQSAMLLASGLVVQRSAMEEAFHHFIMDYNRSVKRCRGRWKSQFGKTGPNPTKKPQPNFEKIILKYIYI